MISYNEVTCLNFEGEIFDLRPNCKAIVTREEFVPQHKKRYEINIWLWLDLNLRPWAYESPALTTELQNLI